MRKTTAPKGVTLIELLVAVTLVSVLFIPLLVTYKTTRTTRALVTSAQTFSDNVKSAQIFSRSARNERVWGIRTTSLTNYEIVSRQSNQSSIQSEYRYALEQGASFTSQHEIWFGEETGQPMSNYTVTIVSQNLKVIDISVSQTGVIQSSQLHSL